MQSHPLIFQFAVSKGIVPEPVDVRSMIKPL
jgi:hypothetical protein